MSILQKQRSKDPTAGYARDFINYLEPVLEECLKRKIKIIRAENEKNMSENIEELKGLENNFMTRQPFSSWWGSIGGSTIIVL